MCGPALGLGLGLLTSFVQFQASQQDYQSRLAMWKQNQVNALAANRDEETALTLRQMQEGDAMVQKVHLENLKEGAAKSEANVAGASAGVSGISVENIIRDIGSQAAFNRSVDEQNYMNTVYQLQSEKKASVNKAQSQINSVPAPVKPNPFAFLLQGLGGGLKSFASMGST